MPLKHSPSVDLEKLALEHIVPRLRSAGYCYLDNILGEELGDQVLAQVRHLHQEGALKDGQLAGNLRGVAKKHLRGDKIAWIAGTEDGCEAIGLVLSVIDRLVVLCGNHLGQFYVEERSKAMVACYPGNGAGYVRHVDNPTKDGRCITCIYYLNKNWDSKVHGGVLRIFPDGGSEVADVEPLFDRLLFFWSDRRNPHEVQPSYAVRYALTVWYFDAKERAAAKQRFKRLSDNHSDASFLAVVSNMLAPVLGTTAVPHARSAQHTDFKENLDRILLPRTAECLSHENMACWSFSCIVYK